MTEYMICWTAGNHARQNVLVRQLPFTVGRSPQASLCLDAALGDVSGMHLRLLEIGDSLCVEDLRSTNGTYLNDRRIHSAVRIKPTDIVGFGKNGPRFVVMPAAMVRGAAVAPARAAVPEPEPEPSPRVGGAAVPGGGDLVQALHAPEKGELPAPSPKGRSVSIDTMMHHLEEVRGSERRRTTRLLGLTVVGMMAIGVLAWWFLRESGDLRGVAKRYEGSIWKVCIKRTFSGRVDYTSLGTAWTVAEGRLATNAHVADEVVKAPAGSIVARVVRNGAPVEVSILGAVIHPDYQVFHDSLNKFRPTIDGRPMGAKGQFDVGLLEVVATDRASLGVPLPIIPRNAPGTTLSQPLCYLGYPSENKDVDPARPDLFCLVGPCARLTDPYFGAVSESGQDGLIGVQMPGAGGASGGPMINARGEVVALLAAGDAVATSDGRVSEGICYGPPATLLLELLEAPASSREPMITARMRELFRASVEDDGFLSVVRDALAKDGQRLVQSEEGDRTLDLDVSEVRRLQVDGDADHVVVVVPEGDPTEFEVEAPKLDQKFTLAHGQAFILPAQPGGHTVTITNGKAPGRLKVRLQKVVKAGG